MDDLKSFCLNIPKIELHAHLNGCIRTTTFRDLLPDNNDKILLDKLNQNDLTGDTHQRMMNVFKKFALLRSCVNDLETIRRITRETLEDFHADNVIYAELRTRPRSFDDQRTSSSLYVEAILETMKSFESRISSRLILSIDRTQTIEQAMETLKLAEQYRPFVVGLDFSGDPNVKSFEKFRPIFDLAKQISLPTTIHIGELPDDECLKENDKIIDFHPNRLGHFNFRTVEQENRVIREKIPLEICPSSNMLTMNLSDLSQHHFNIFYAQRNPLSICTDDSGLMNCSLSSEVFNVGQTFGLSKNDIYQSLIRTCELIFDQNQIDACRKHFQTFRKEHFSD